MNFTYTVKRDRFDYEIFYNDELIFVGKRKQRLLRGDITQIYFVSDNNLFAELQEQYFMFFGFGYTINYLHGDKLIKIRNKFGVKDGVFDNKTYSIKYRLFTRDGNLYVDNQSVGQYTILDVDYSRKSFQIQTTTKEQCINFTMIEIAMDDWGI